MRNRILVISCISALVIGAAFLALGHGFQGPGMHGGGEGPSHGDMLEHMSIPEAVRFCRGLTAHTIYRVFTRKGEHGLVPPKPVKDAILDLLCAPKMPPSKQVPRRRANARDYAFHETRGYTGFLRKYCKRHKISVHIDEVRRRVGQTQHRRMMVIARALGPVLMLDEAFRMRVTIKLISKFPGTRRMAEKILVAESRQP